MGAVRGAPEVAVPLPNLERWYRAEAKQVRELWFQTVMPEASRGEPPEPRAASQLRDGLGRCGHFRVLAG